MIFNPEGFRYFDGDSTPWFSLRNSGSITLIVITSNGDASYSNTRSGKDIMVGCMDWNKDLMLVAWNGNYKSDIFHVRKEDIDEYYHESQTERNPTK